MSGDKINDDEYVARLLKQDAVEAAKKYSFVGLDAFHAKRNKTNEATSGQDMSGIDREMRTEDIGGDIVLIGQNDRFVIPTIDGKASTILEGAPTKHVLHGMKSTIAINAEDQDPLRALLRLLPVDITTLRGTAEELILPHGGPEAQQSRPMGQKDDSDPLEAIVGPLPPPKQPAVRSRGRGAHKSDAEGINARFSAAYDPALDNEPLSNNGDQWGDAVEAYRDRQRWKQQGAERLKAAGFSDEQVRKWERGDEKTEEDVRWTARGQSREWDRGKVVDADGDIGHRATWVED
ncbi:hypothetical protein SLS60_001278 [Paraconiothyrium brasiliense]|uniref:Uncharacterized protein n=1 Tax=Paraconiothyrium brasiliense TaxID=300254 RepID=A0ABR3S8M9_9PLEO